MATNSEITSLRAPPRPQTLARKLAKLSDEGRWTMCAYRSSRPNGLQVSLCPTATCGDAGGRVGLSAIHRPAILYPAIGAIVWRPCAGLRRPRSFSAAYWRVCDIKSTADSLVPRHFNRCWACSGYGGVSDTCSSGTGRSSTDPVNAWRRRPSARRLQLLGTSLGWPPGDGIMLTCAI